MKKVLIAVVLLGLIGGGVYLYMNKPHRDIDAEVASVKVTSVQLGQDYREDMEGANAIYLDKVVEVTGIAAEVADDHILLEGGTYCKLAEAQNKTAQAGDEVTIKGRVVSFDDLFEEVRMDFCQVL